MKRKLKQIILGLLLAAMLLAAAGCGAQEKPPNADTEPPVQSTSQSDLDVAPSAAKPNVESETQSESEPEFSSGLSVQAQWAEQSRLEDISYDKFIADDDEYAEDILFTPACRVTDFALMRLFIQDVTEDGRASYVTELLYSLDELTPARPLVVRMTFPGDTPAYGISYQDESGTTHWLTVSISGYDGSIELMETDEF